ncbi:MAG TPA: ABC transporter ATP-binding protein [Treponemataceae bacterium]|mgnify:FL=1|nr:ABC transporter ATP-binding protein [Treponemataceae bacterium]
MTGTGTVGTEHTGLDRADGCAADEKKMPILELESVSAGYGKRGRDIISGITFSVQDGERLSVIGPNGSGKTTLLRVLSGALPYRGSVRIRTTRGPRELSELAPKERAQCTGVLSQLTGAHFPFTVADTVLLGRYARKKSVPGGDFSDADRLDAREAMRICSVLDRADELLTRLSGGQKQRVFLARTIAQDPAVLLLDEPTNHLDLGSQLELIALIGGLYAQKGKAAIGVFHDLSLALRFSDTMILLDSGRIAQNGLPDDVVRSPEIEQAYGIPVAERMRELLAQW